jgi:hypothetical protein
VVPDAEVTVDLNLLRALNPKHYEDGLPGPNHFVMKLDAGAEDGVSTGIEALIKVDQMRGLQGTSAQVRDLLVATLPQILS